jgi:hypothetical protein
VTGSRSLVWWRLMSSGASTAADSRPFSVFGVVVHCDFPCDLGRPSAGPVDVYVRADSTLAVPEGPPTVSLPLRNPDGGRGVFVYARQGETIIVVDSVAVFCCTAHGVGYHMLRPLPLESLVWQLFGFVFSFWLESRGRRVFHGAAIQVNERHAIGLLGHSGAGKSSLAVAFARLGCRVLGDDHLIIDAHEGGLYAGPALPWLKLDPDAATVLDLDIRAMPALHARARKRRFDLPEAWQAPLPIPLRRLLILNRGGAVTPSIGPNLSAAEALRRLLRHSSVPRTAQALGFSGDRLTVLARLTAEIPVGVLDYPDDLRALPEVATALHGTILGDIVRPS